MVGPGSSSHRRRLGTGWKVDAQRASEGPEPGSDKGGWGNERPPGRPPQGPPGLEKILRGNWKYTRDREAGPCPPRRGNRAVVDRGRNKLRKRKFENRAENRGTSPGGC
ncbi:hypothetical protein NDU88_005974 [Pleurodeles waltl]|uniref:Uncharacterized protein n=1 Tax=Pleurodeles waltl TaxID=8319 RepID=A0AAV7N5V8_PLEWA|nr:hypothetical protein NDU88_005974 [Pleurodeles waltl]